MLHIFKDENESHLFILNVHCGIFSFFKSMQTNPDYANLFRGRPLRFILPMKTISDNTSVEENLITAETVNQSVVKDLSSNKHSKRKRKNVENQLNDKASAHRMVDGKIFVKPELLCDLGLETPRINYDHFLGKEYRYFYGISSDVDLENPGTVREREENDLIYWKI